LFARFPLGRYIVNMVRKTSWLALLLLVASIQLFATVCATKCALMSMPTRNAAVNSAMPGMDNCDGSMVEASRNDLDSHVIQAPEGCTHDICKTDLSVTKDRVAVDQMDAALQILAGAALDLPVWAMEPSMDRSWRPPASRTTNVRSNLIPLISNLRV
jgi:hypothetical protein